MRRVRADRVITTASRSDTERRCRGRIRSVRIDPSVVDATDVEMLEDLVLAAVSEAQSRATAVYEEEMKKVSGGLSLPFQLPGL